MSDKPQTTEMKMHMVHISLNEESPHYISAEIDVPGLGKVTIKDCLSDETIEKISAEVVFALKQKMGQEK